jgi:hypothetical protein
MSANTLQWLTIDTAPSDVSFFAADSEGRYYLGSIIDDVFHNANGKIPYTPPTHWMPLPDPPIHLQGAQ